MLARREDKLKETLALLEKGDHSYYAVDLTSFDLLEPIISEAVGKSGKISGLVQCAGKEMTLPINMINNKLYEDIFSVNLFSAFELIKIIINKKYSSAGTSIVLISSINSVVGNAGLSLYSATKGAMVAAVRSLSVELAGRNIRINCISPGFVKTEMFDSLYDKISPDQIARTISEYPLGIGTPEDIANACVFLISDASRWITGTNLIVDGGFTAR